MCIRDRLLAMQNIETLDAMGAKQIITQCPHCFNTLANEYPQLGGHYDVIHHSEFLEQLIEDGDLDMSNASLAERIVYHDACYLGRHNDVYLAPRKVIGSLGGVQVLEAENNGTKSMCCGAGGGRFWMEETVGKDVNVERSQQLLATGANRIATACPFCYVMIDDGVKGQGVEEDEVKVADIAIHMLEALENGDEVARQAALSPRFASVDTPVSLAGAGATATLKAPASVVVEAQEPEPAPVVHDDIEVIADPDPEVVPDPEPADEAMTDDSDDAPWRTVEADDLKVIKGIGPKLESLLHEIGVRTYEQIAAFPASYITQLDDFLSFTGRIDRDNWVGQAAELAKSRPEKTAVLPPIPDDTPENATA